MTAPHTRMRGSSKPALKCRSKESKIRFWLGRNSFRISFLSDLAMAEEIRYH